MSLFISRTQAQYLDILYLGIKGILNANSSISRYDILNYSISDSSFEGVNQFILKKQIDRYNSISDRRYIRTLSYVHLVLDLIEDTYIKEFFSANYFNNKDYTKEPTPTPLFNSNWLR